MKKSNSHYLRSSGILAHITSLPSSYGIGDMGPGTYDFLRFLAKSKQHIWQILPLGPTDDAFFHSPYMTISAFAGNPLIISPDLLCEEGLVTRKEVEALHAPSPYKVDFDTVCRQKNGLMRKAFSRFQEVGSDFKQFVEHTGWLQDYCLFKVLKAQNTGKPWYKWDKAFLHRNAKALATIRRSQAEEIRYYQFEQYIFSRQWDKLHSFATDLGIDIFGDIPIYLGLDSADVWANQDIFQLDCKTGTPTHVSGVPPDYFSETGQKWGNPLYRWNAKDTQVKKRLTDWWCDRFATVFQQVDIARIDHFRGFASYWSVPDEHKTALKGQWRKGPGRQFFLDVFEKLGPLDIVAEDLGDITKDVIELRDSLNFPGMKILQFAFDGNPDNYFLPYNYTTPQAFVYTGTHDNDTTVGWYLGNRVDDTLRQRVKKLANRELHDEHPIHVDLIYLAMSSIAAVSIFPLQDILGFGSDCRMNTPGTVKGNWTWRCSKEFLTEDIATWLGDLTTLFRRHQPVKETQTEKDSPQSKTKS